MSSSRSAMIPKRARNRRREGYELTKQRAMLPIALGAACAAAMLHIGVFIWGPSVIHLNFNKLFDVPERVQDEEIRVVVKQKPEDELEEAKEEEPPPPMDEPQEIAHEPLEIDIIDAEMEELVMAPGKTELTLPEPVYTQESTPTISELPPAQIDVGALQMDPVPREALNIPEPSPVNSNDVVIAAEAQPEAVEEASSLMEKELRESASKLGNGELPADTRSLSDLLGEGNLSAKSGVARLGADVLFGFNESQLKNSARITMLQLAALIQKNPETVFIIEGHTDSLGGDEYNALLGMQRAAAVRAWLSGNNVPIDNVYIRSCGCSAPLASTKLPKEQQTLNRRVEIHMRKKEDAIPEGSMPSTFKVDMKTAVRTQLTKGVRVPLSKSITPGIIEKLEQSAPAPAGK